MTRELAEPNVRGRWQTPVSVRAVRGMAEPVGGPEQALDCLSYCPTDGLGLGDVTTWEPRPVVLPPCANNWPLSLLEKLSTEPPLKLQC